MEKKKKEYTTEEIVNEIAKKPTFLNIILFFGLMTFNTDGAMVAYFPNFGGYLPYSDWRCLDNSTECLRRTENFTGSGWKDVSAKHDAVYLDSRCSIKVTDMDTDNAVVMLLTTYKEDTANITLRISENKLKIDSNSSCSSDSKCSEEKTSLFDKNVKKRVCQIDLKAGYDSTISCNDSTISDLKLGDVYGLKDATNTVRYVKFAGIGSYELSCPDPTQYSKNGMCGAKDEKQLMPDVDFYWYTKGRSTFAIDWKLYCGGEFLRTMIGSIYFGGAFLGTLGGGILYDMIGRKKGALIGYIVIIVSTFCSAVSPSIEFLFVCRFLQGLGVFLGYSGMFVLMLEYTAAKYRNIANSSVLVYWAVGYLLTTFFAYLIKSWHWLAASAGFLYAASLIPFLLVPESPRYFVVNKKDKKAAKESLAWLKKLNNSDFDLDSAIIKEVSENETKDKEPSYMDTLRDFIKYKELTIQLLLQMWMWMVCGFLYYGFSFSWSELGNDLYLSYLYAAIGEVIAYVGMTPLLAYLGRKFSMLLMFCVASASFLLAMIHYSFGEALTFEQLSCLVGSMFVSAAFGSIYLYTIELAPTSHRGRMLGYCSFAARIGSFCGPQADLLFSWNKTGTLILFSSLAGLAGLCTLRLPRTKGIATPNTAEEVQQRKTGFKSMGIQIKDAEIHINENV